MNSAIVETKTEPRPEFTEPGVLADVCGNRSKFTWERFKPWTKVSLGAFFRGGVMLNARLYSQLHTQGCGGIYTGHAIGELHHGKKWSHPDERRLSFSYCSGDFCDAETGALLTQVSVLILRPNLKSAYLP